LKRESNENDNELGKQSPEKMTVADAGMLKVLFLLIGMVSGASFSLYVKHYLYFFVAVIVILWAILGWKFYRK
jgi:cation transport ATPase